MVGASREAKLLGRMLVCVGLVSHEGLGQQKSALRRCLFSHRIPESGLVPRVGLEPTRLAAGDFESGSLCFLACSRLC